MAPFVTQQELSDYLGRDVTSDDGALFALTAACDICRDVAEQQFTAGTVTTSFDGAGTDVLILPERPVRTVGTVTVDGTAETDYEFAADGRLLRGTAGPNPRPTWPDGRQNISVTYEYGYETLDLPHSVRMVALQIAARLVVQGVAKRETVGALSIDYATAATDLTAGETRILGRYRQTRSF